MGSHLSADVKISGPAAPAFCLISDWLQATAQAMGWPSANPSYNWSEDSRNNVVIGVACAMLSLPGAKPHTFSLVCVELCDREFGNPEPRFPADGRLTKKVYLLDSGQGLLMMARRPEDLLDPRPLWFAAAPEATAALIAGQSAQYPQVEHWHHRVSRMTSKTRGKLLPAEQALCMVALDRWPEVVAAHELAQLERDTPQAALPPPRGIRL